jgi:hypothetical protein
MDGNDIPLTSKLADLPTEFVVWLLLWLRNFIGEFNPVEVFELLDSLNIEVLNEISGKWYLESEYDPFKLEVDSFLMIGKLGFELEQFDNDE